ncbi:MAG: 4'-phosphopantetheinyl transferase superfamily protein [Bacteroidetes bacterium]|nr:MAG: 4'-phosphopantetheinyl transferase superfamily protein [Bacteroidota bacterium]
MESPIQIGYVQIPGTFTETAAVSYIHSLPEYEKAAFYSKAKPLARLQFLFGRLLIRHLYGRLNPGGAYAIQLDHYGKPHIAGQPQTGISISHSGQIVVGAIRSEGPVGLDVEAIRPIQWENFRTSFQDTEWQYIQKHPNTLSAFYSLWTRKEAIAKADGRGIGLDFQQINVLANPVLTPTQQWSCAQILTTEKYIAALGFLQKNTEPAVYVRKLEITELLDQ